MYPTFQTKNNNLFLDETQGEPTIVSPSWSFLYLIFNSLIKKVGLYLKIFWINMCKLWLELTKCNYFLIDEESENGDGDDIDFQPEDSAKLAQNKTIQNKSKSSSANVDQGT